MENRKIVVKYCLGQKGQKSEILSGRSGESERTANIIVDAEILESPYVRINGQGEVELDKGYPCDGWKGYPCDGWTCGFGGYEIRCANDEYYAHPLKIDVYTSDKVLTDAEITEIYRLRIVKKYTDRVAEEYNMRVRAEWENQCRDEMKKIEKLHTEGKLYYRKENGQFDKI